MGSINQEDTPKSCLRAFLNTYPEVKFLRLVHTVYAGSQLVKAIPIHHALLLAEKANCLRPGAELAPASAMNGDHPNETGKEDQADARGVIRGSPNHVAGMFSLFDDTGRANMSALAEGIMSIQIDWTSLRPLLWAPTHAYAACCLYQSDALGQLGYGYDADPRIVLQRVVKSAKDAHGLECKMGVEIEFCLFDQSDLSQPLQMPTAMAFANLFETKGMTVVEEIVAALEYAGVHVWSFHHESMPSGQFELQTCPADPLSTCDQVQFAAHVLRCIASKHNLIATMSSYPGKGMQAGRHIHISHNLGKEQDDHFMAGILEHMPAMSIIHSASLDGYVRRLRYLGTSHFFWSNSKSSPIYRKTTGRYEIRPPDAHQSIYLQAAALIAAGADGLKRELRPSQTESMPMELVFRFLGMPIHSEEKNKVIEQYKLDPTVPSSLGEAIEAYKNELDFWVDAFGEEAAKGVLATQVFKWSHHEDMTEEERRVSIIKKMG